MRTKTVCIWIFLALLGSAASANANCTLPGDPPSDPVTDTCISASDAATSWRYLATRSGGAACPTATGWIGGKLFGNGPLPPGLDAYCGYEAVDQSSAVTALSALLCTADSPPNCLNELEADLLALTYLATQAVEGLVVNE